MFQQEQHTLQQELIRVFFVETLPAILKIKKITKRSSEEIIWYNTIMLFFEISFLL